ncbi:hypothetical protein M3R28_09505 [Pseudomonas syringae]|uniref:hypothetical protein n=1 Tax=Pseudomonas syringae TaxID=317 RepID=UPI0003A4D82A|nr:hypothetical protein [Pseudomonas syringae]MCL6307139.1 hypothetical protein [Pseudomonas syringae]
MIKVMLSLDLMDVVQNVRNEFYAELATDGWKKANNVDTVWLKDFSAYTTLGEEQLKKLRNEVADSIINPASKLKVKQVFYVAQLGNSVVISRVVENRNGAFKAFTQDLH